MTTDVSERLLLVYARKYHLSAMGGTIHGKSQEQRLEETEAAKLALQEAIDADSRLPADVVRMCRHRGWSMHWTHRGAYLHLESSELIEAIRGKGGDPLKEAADVLLVLMSITEYAGIAWAAVLMEARTKCDEMMVRPHYAGEEYDPAQSTNNERAG